LRERHPNHQFFCIYCNRICDEVFIHSLFRSFISNITIITIININLFKSISSFDPNN
jgi:hypothetical protein